MLLRDCLAQGISEGALASQHAISRNTIHRWIRDGELERRSQIRQDGTEKAAGREGATAPPAGL